MNILFTVCARAGSKGIKNKNIREFLGKPLVLYTLSAIDLYMTKHPEVSADIVVNTDSEELIRIVENNQLRPVYIVRREEYLGGDKVAKIDVIFDALQKISEHSMKKYDMVVDLDVTAPLRCVKDIENLILKKAETNCDVAFSVTDSRRNPYFNMVRKTEKGYCRVLESNFVTRQEAPKIYDMNASMYAYDVEYLKTGKGVLDGYCEVIQMYDTGILDLDQENDFELMEVIAGYLFENNTGFGEIRNNLISKLV